jgi:thioredoxin-related protein
MKLFVFAFYFLSTPVVWLDNIHDAQQRARASHQLILVYFSGSDWCVPCIRLKKDLMESNAFMDYAAEHLVLVRADFPRNKKNQLSAEQQKVNEALAERYNRDGKFPYTLLLDEKGTLLKSWDGYINETALEFTREIAEVNSTTYEYKN